MDSVHPEEYLISVTSAFGLGAVLLEVKIYHFFEYVVLLILTIGVLAPFFGEDKSEE